MAFSVLMSVYRKENPEWLIASLDSVFNQTVTPDEVVLVEDGELTGELDAVIEIQKQKHPELKIVTYKENRGLGKALHDGLLECSNNLVARMDTDDICFPTRFEKQLQVFERHPEVDVCSAWIDEFETDPEQVISVRRLPKTYDELFMFGKKRNPVSHPVSMFKKDSVLSVGNYQDFPLFEDYYLWARMMVKGCKFYCIQESLLKFRRSPEMIKRRGGWDYAITEVRFFNTLRKIGYISNVQLAKNVCTRFVVRIIPNSLRTALYKQIRKK